MDEKSLIDVLSQDGLTNTDKLLAVLLFLGPDPQSARTIKEKTIACGFPEARSWNVSTLLSSSKQRVVRSSKGWILSSMSRKYAGSLLRPHKTPIESQLVHLRNVLAKISSEETKTFLDEAIRAVEVSPPLLRSAVVLSWVGAVAVLQDYVLRHDLAAFNAEMVARKAKNPKFYPILSFVNSRDDLSIIKEFDFLTILGSIGVIGHSLKKDLLGCLDLRNACGHPNSFNLGHHKVTAHLETLILNVFTKY